MESLLGVNMNKKLYNKAVSQVARNSGVKSIELKMAASIPEQQQIMKVYNHLKIK